MGCVLPRSRAHWAAVRARPPAAPRNLTRLPVHRSWTTDRDAAEASSTVARQALRAERFRVDDGDGSVAAERGLLRETGNLVFHLALLLLLVAVALGSLFGFKANVLVVEGRGFANTLDRLRHLRRRRRSSATASCAPFTFALDDLAVRYQQDGDQRGAPRDFRRQVSWPPAPGDARQQGTPAGQPPARRSTAPRSSCSATATPRCSRSATRPATVVSRGPVPFLPHDGS